MIPHRTPFFLPWVYPTLLWSMPRTGMDLYLTFDDGPVPGPTEFVLDTLRSFGIKATFFCIGENVQRHPHIFRQLMQAGHAVGNHTQSHLSGWQTPVGRYCDSVSACEKVFTTHGRLAVTGKKKLFRPPYGRITGPQIKALHPHYEIVMWDVLTQDYRRGLSPQQCLERSMNAVRPGALIVFHDSMKAAANMEFALPRLIERCLGRGYQFKSLEP